MGIAVLVSLLLLLFSTVTGRAQTEGNDVRKVVLTDGVRLLLKPEPPTDVVAVSVFVRMEPDRSPVEAATGEMVAHALFYGSTNRSFDSIAASVAQVGGSLEVLRTPDYVVLTCVTVSEQMGEAIYLLCEAIKNADFAPDALERARTDILQERLRREQDGFAGAYESLVARKHGDPDVDPGLLRRVTQEQAQDYFRRRYVPARTVISVVGRFNVQRIQSTFDNSLDDYDRQPLRSPSLSGVSSSTFGATQAATFSATGNAAYALVGTAAPEVTSPDYPAFTVLQALLGSGHASRLFRRVRDTLGIGYTVGASYRADRAEPLIAYLQWDVRRAASEASGAPPAPAGALKLLNTQLDGLLTDPPTEAEVARARSVTIGRDALNHERARDRAFLLGWYEVMGMGAAFDADFSHRLAAVTRDDVLRVAKTYLPDRASALAVPNNR